ncbi:hypothetical protein VQ042_13055 [Aurantimonas sp. A2-1-M11]|uniref:hypothetical protein n=1 Tax=Aurantimonas sp. A2-1-M11 TaxID=3113712 RepID=UPI002F95D4E7
MSLRARMVSDSILICGAYRTRSSIRQAMPPPRRASTGTGFGVGGQGGGSEPPGRRHSRREVCGHPERGLHDPGADPRGWSEDEALKQNLTFETKFTDMRGWFTTRRFAESAAVAKVRIEPGSGRILRAHILGPESVELINLFSLAMRNGLRNADLENFGSAYPSGASDLTLLI